MAVNDALENKKTRRKRAAFFNAGEARRGKERTKGLRCGWRARIFMNTFTDAVRKREGERGREREEKSERKRVAFARDWLQLQRDRGTLRSRSKMIRSGTPLFFLLFH